MVLQLIYLISLLPGTVAAITLSHFVSSDIKSAKYFSVFIELLIFTLIIVSVKWIFTQALAEKDSKVYFSGNYYFEVFSWMLVLLFFVLTDFYNF
jgi:hypothetical protein